jgi:hypothetical protein
VGALADMKAPADSGTRRLDALKHGQVIRRASIAGLA